MDKIKYIVHIVHVRQEEETLYRLSILDVLRKELILHLISIRSSFQNL